MHNKRRRLLATLLAAIVAIGALVGGVTLARADGETDAPAPGYSKTLADNGDGTYTLKLSVTGSQTKTEETKGAHVIFVADVSGSMNDSVSNTPSYVEDNSRGIYGKVGDQYVDLYYKRSSRWGSSYRRVADARNYPSGPYYLCEDQQRLG